MKELKSRGLESPYLRNFVVARINPVRFLRGKTMPLDDALEKMEASAQKFDAARIKVGDLARSGGGAGTPEE